MRSRSLAPPVGLRFPLLSIRFSTIVILALAALTLRPSASFGGDRLTPELLWKLGRLGDAAISPAGDRIAYTVRRYDLEEDSGSSSIHTTPIQSGKSRKILAGLKSVSNLQWSTQNEETRLFFVAIPKDEKEKAESKDDQDDDGDKAPEQDPESVSQVWSCRADGSDLKRVTSIAGGVANLKVSPTGTHLAFTVDVKLDSTVNELFEDLPKADARIIDSLLYRHWNAWHDYKYSHIHVAALKDDGTADEAKDLMAGLRADSPVPPFGGAEQFAWSPDGKEIAYTAKLVRNWAESTDSDVYLVDVSGEGRTRCITSGMDGYDNEPSYSPDGRYLAFHSMRRPSFESDRNRILIFDRSSGEIEELTVGLDRTTHGATWTPDSRGVLFVSEHRGTNQIFSLTLGQKGETQITRGRYNWSLRDISSDGKTLLAARMSMLRPYELFSVSRESGQAQSLTQINDATYSELELPKIEERWVRASDGESVHNWVIYPPDFDPSKKWPMITYCQGGPQGQIGQWFSYRWNFHLMAANGYVVLAVNRRGLPGFGREWNDQISGDWGGQAMQDILSSTDDMLTERYVDDERVAAVGASFGGYTVFWMMGNSQDRFCTMIAHCGVFNLESMYGSTEELFFVNWDLGGPYWKSSKIQRDYDRFSPHQFVGRWKTPLLIIHGEKDFRVPVTQGMEAFTAAQVQGVPSRFLYYPNEGHWVLGPQNGVLWHRVFFDWLGRYCKK